MLHKQIQESDFVGLEFRELFEDGVGDEVGASGLGGEGDTFLEPHGGWVGGGC